MRRPVVLLTGVLILLIAHSAWAVKVQPRKQKKSPKLAADTTAAAIPPGPDTALKPVMPPPKPMADSIPMADTRGRADTTVTDTSPQPDTIYFTASTSGRFYHKSTFAHAPPHGGKGVLAHLDSSVLDDTYQACPICFQSPITEEDYELEEAIGNQVSGIVEFRYRKSEDDRIGARLNRIGQPMTKILDRRHVEFFFTPLRSSLEKNAISAGNGYIYFTTGLLDILEDDEEVAAVLAHEISHAEFRHVLQDFKLSQKLTLITAIASAVLNKTANIGGVLQVLQDYAVHLVMNGFSRQFELEADAGAKWILESTGHDTHGMRRVLLKLDDLYQDRRERATIFQTHPEESERIKAFDGTKIFNKIVKGDTVSMRLKFQRPRMVGWFKERAVPALYATLINETDSPLMLYEMSATYSAIDMPDVKVEIDPSKVFVPERSYAQIKILIIARQELSRSPRAVDFSCTVRNLADESPQRDSKGKKKQPSRVSFHFDLME